VLALSGLRGMNSVSRVKRGWWNKKSLRNTGLDHQNHMKQTWHWFYTSYQIKRPESEKYENKVLFWPCSNWNFRQVLR